MSTVERTFGGRYATVEQIGSGGMAEVYRARDELLGRDVALKVLNERLSRDNSFVERFRREAQAAANLNHPNVVALYDYGSDAGMYFIVMEYIDGRPLSEVIAQEGPLTAERASEIAADVAKALDRAHAAGLVHRDIKPSNIMITKTGQTKVTDFGIARARTGNGEQTVTQTGMVIGTASYLSPEQAQGNSVDGRSDLYALGVVLYEMLTGRPPFRGDSPLSIAYKHVRETPEPPSSMNPDVPPEMDAVTLKALAKNPDNRYSSAAEMEEDLQRFVAGQTVRATPLLPQETAVAPRRDRTQILDVDERREEDDEPRRSAMPYVLVTLIILAIVGLIAWALFDSLVGADTVSVPGVEGLQVEEAERRLEARGLEADIEERADADVPEGEVIDQDPEKGRDIEEGGAVKLVVSTGPEMTDVPEVTDVKLKEAKQILREADLRWNVTREPSDTADKGTVIRQFPSAGQEIRVGRKVDLVVSSGPAPVAVPSVVGLTQDEATEALEEAELEVEVSSAPSEADEGVVFAQDPTAGSQVPPGTVVRITVSEGPAAQEMPDVRGMDADEAEALLESEYELDVSTKDAREPCSEPPGVVCEQEPEPGTEVEPGDKATLYVQPGEADAGLGDFAFAWLLFGLWAALA